MTFFQFIKENPIYLLWIYFALMSIITFVIMGIDKLKSKTQTRRVPESTLFLLAIFGGSVGGILGIYAFRHKTLHKKFTVGFPLILILQIALGVCMYIFLNK